MPIDDDFLKRLKDSKKKAHQSTYQKYEAVKFDADKIQHDEKELSNKEAEIQKKQQKLEKALGINLEEYISKTAVGADLSQYATDETKFVLEKDAETQKQITTIIAEKKAIETQRKEIESQKTNLEKQLGDIESLIQNLKERDDDLKKQTVELENIKVRIERKKTETAEQRKPPENKPLVQETKTEEIEDIQRAFIATDTHRDKNRAKTDAILDEMKRLEKETFTKPQPPKEEPKTDRMVEKTNPEPSPEPTKKRNIIVLASALVLLLIALAVGITVYTVIVQQNPTDETPNMLIGTIQENKTQPHINSPTTSVTNPNYYQKNTPIPYKTTTTTIRTIPDMKNRPELATKISQCRLMDEYNKECRCYKDVAVENNDPNICELPDNQDKKDCCYMMSGRNFKDTTICERITQEWRKNTCYTGIVFETEDTSLCDRITNDYDRNVCANIFSKTYTLQNTPPSTCYESTDCGFPSQILVCEHAPEMVRRQTVMPLCIKPGEPDAHCSTRVITEKSPIEVCEERTYCDSGTCIPYATTTTTTTSIPKKVACSSKEDCGNATNKNICLNGDVYTLSINPICTSPGKINAQCQQTNTTSIMPIEKCLPPRTCIDGECIGTLYPQNNPQKPVICNTSFDCPPTMSKTHCLGPSIIEESLIYSCMNPGTTSSFCAQTPKTTTLDSCYGQKQCIDGIPKCMNQYQTKTETCVETTGYDPNKPIYVFNKNCGLDKKEDLQNMEGNWGIDYQFVDNGLLNENEKTILGCFYGPYSKYNTQYNQCPRLLCPKTGKVEDTLTRRPLSTDMRQLVDFALECR